MLTEYQHTQRGTFFIVFFSVLIAVLSVLGVLFLPALFWSAGVFAVLLLVFHSLTVTVSRDEIKLRYGIGPITLRFQVADIDSVETVTNRFWYGWGIKYTPHGWLFNIAGFEAVQLKMKTGKQYRIGTDEPEALHRVIEKMIQQQEG